MKIKFETSEYEFSHGAKPRGFGSWCFSVERDLICDLESEQELKEFNARVGGDYVWISQKTYSQAKKIASQVAKMRNWEFLFVMP